MGLERVGVTAGIMTAGLISWRKFWAWAGSSSEETNKLVNSFPVEICWRIPDVKSSIVNSFEPEIEVWLVELLSFKVMRLFICVPLGTFREWHLLCLFFSRFNLLEKVLFWDFFRANLISELQIIFVVFRAKFKFAWSVGGDGSAIYRPGKRIASAAALRGMVEMCNTELNLALFPDEVNAIAAVLNRDFYRFK